MTLLRGVLPRAECAARSLGPRYASVSTIRPTRRTAAILVHEMHADELARDEQRAACVELARQLCEPVSKVQSIGRLCTPHRQSAPDYARITPATFQPESTPCTPFVSFRRPCSRRCFTQRRPGPPHMSSARARRSCSARSRTTRPRTKTRFTDIARRYSLGYEEIIRANPGHRSVVARCGQGHGDSRAAHPAVGRARRHRDQSA